MKIIEPNWKWNSKLTNRTSTDYIVLHHADAKVCSETDIDRWHKQKGWSGIGYHFFVRKDGTVYRGRPLMTTGAHVSGSNSISIGICAEGDYSKESTMPATQFNAIGELVVYLKEVFPKAKVVGHGEIGASSCPGRFYPLNELKNYKKTEDNEMAEQIYNWTTACPEWSRPYVQKALDMGIIRGDENGNLNLTDTKIWCLVITLRVAGVMK